MIKVLHLINNLAREGAQVVVNNIVTYPGSGEFEHVVFSREPNGQLQSALEHSGVKVFSPDKYFGIAKTGRSVAFIHGLVEKEGIDIIHAHMGDAAFLGWLVARKRKLPMFISHHGHDVLPVCSGLCRIIYSVLIKWSADYAKRNIAVSESVADQVRGKLGISDDKICVITNGVPVPEDMELVKTEDVSVSSLRVVTVGRLVDLKGQDQFIKMAVVLLKEYPEALFYLVGDGPLRSELEQLVAECGATGSVIFTGVIENVTHYLQQADVYVSTSHSEGMPMATLEAMAWSVPVIASDILGNRSVVQHGETGLLYSLGDVNALKDKIIEVISFPGAAEQRCLLARKMVKNLYSVNATIQAHEKLYSSVVRT